MDGRPPTYGPRQFSPSLDVRMTDSSLRDGSHAARREIENLRHANPTHRHVAS